MAEKKYIDSEKVIKLLRKDLICKYPLSFSFGLWAAADEIAKMDGEDVRPAKRGVWLEAGKSSLFPDDTIYGCSVCYCKYIAPHKFCPNCGADMRPVTDDGQ